MMFKYLLAPIILSLWGLSKGQKAVTQSCQEVPGSPNIVRVVFRILKNGDPVSKVYAFNAANGDTTLSANRINDCMRNGNVDPIEFSVDVDITAAAHTCGAAVTDVTAYKKVALLFRAYSSSDTMLTADDASYSVLCRSDQLDNSQITLGELDASGGTNINVQSPQIGAYMRLRNPDTLRPLSAVTVGEPAILSVEFTPSLDMGPDNYGTHFFVGFLRNEPISGTSSLKLYVQLLPRYAVRTDITITHDHGSQSYNISNGSPLTVYFDSTFMGNAEAGRYMTAKLGIEIYSYDREISVVVCNEEPDSTGCYSALPTDVTCTDYYTVSMPSAGDPSAFMVIAQEDATQVNITIPSGSSHSVQPSYNAGDTFTISLDKRGTAYLSQTLNVENNAHVCGYHIVSTKPVTVISGNVKYQSDHMIEQMPPVSKFGDHYVLAPAIPLDDTRTTKYIIQAVETGTTTLKFYTSSSPSTFSSYNISTRQNPPLILIVPSSSPGELTSDNPIFVTQVVEDSGAAGFQHAMVILPSIQQWAHTYIFNSPMKFNSMGVVYHNTSKVYVSSLLTSPTVITAVKGHGGYVFGSFQQPPRLGVQTLLCDRSCLFIAYTWTNNGTGAAFALPGTRYSDFDFCDPVGVRGDLLDNDCDGTIDEEIVDGVDNDEDGYIDEDASGLATENIAAVAIRPVNCKVSGDSSFTVFQQITGSDGCIVADQPFSPANNFTSVTGSTFGKGIQTKILHSGVFKIAMFIDKPQLFFMCDIGQYCLSASDAMCTTSICNPVRKRSVEDPSVDNITVGVVVFPYNARSSEWNSSSGNTDAASSLKDCIKNDSIILIISLPLVLAVMCCCFAICVCMMYRKQLNKISSATDVPKYWLYRGN